MNNPNSNDLETQKRIFLALLLIFVLFFAYEYFVLKPVQDDSTQPNVQNEKLVDNKKAPILSGEKLSKEKLSIPVDNELSSNDIISTITTSNNVMKIDQFGRIAQVTLTSKQYLDENNKPIELFDPVQLRPLEVRFVDSTLNDVAFKKPVVASQAVIDATTKIQTLVLKQTLNSDVILTKELKIYPDGHYNVDVKISGSKAFFITPGFRPNVLVDMYADHGVLMKLNDGSIQTVFDEDLERTKTFNDVSFVSAFDRYYSTVLYNFKEPLNITLMPDHDDNPQAFIYAKGHIKLNGYIGAKEFDTLKRLNPELTDVIEYGFFTFLAKPMFTLLQFIYAYIGNWGWTIVILTLIIKLILYPLSYKGMVSMQKLKDLAPKIKDIQLKYKDDKQKASMHMMELYKKHGANPMGGCFPILLQIPIFFAIYRVLLNSIELKGAPWILWIEDLALMDPWFILPILMGISMYIQQKITPNAMQDEMQKKIFQILPFIFTFFFLWFPAGLTLYWFVNNVFTIIQQYYINHLFNQKRKNINS